MAQVGDWVVGTGSAARKRSGHLVYAMQVTETMSFDEYWADQRFFCKRPNLRASKKLAFGDNIYSRAVNGSWAQVDSHHSLPDGSPNPKNTVADTQTNRILVGSEFVYWGGSGPVIPQLFRDFDGHDVCARRGHKSNFPSELVVQFVGWIKSHGRRGYCGDPLDWSRTP